MTLNKAARQKHWTLNFSISVLALRMDPTLFVFSDGSFPCDNVSCVVIPPLLLEYYEAKRQWHIVVVVFFFSWKAAPEIPRYFHNRVHGGTVTKATRENYDTNQTL